jgi:hypothetical protein
MIRMLSWDDLRARGVPHSKSQIRRQIKAGKFPPPDGYIGKFPFWTDETVDRHTEGPIAEQARRR